MSVLVEISSSLAISIHRDPVCRVWHGGTGDIFALQLLHTGYVQGVANNGDVHGRGLYCKATLVRNQVSSIVCLAI